jgi:uncharacterized protein YndB with AHSA1/START domain
MSNDSKNAVRLSRTFDASQAVLWRMWTDPDEFAAWYGPDGATVRVTVMDVRPGGSRRVGMEVMTPGGPANMWFTGEFREVVEPDRLVYTEAVSDESGVVADPHGVTEVEVELYDEGGRTTVVVTHHGIPAGSPGAAGWAMALDHLAVLVAA